MPRKLNLDGLKTKIQGSEKMTSAPTKIGTHLDTTNNTNYQVLKAFNTLPGVYDAQTNAVAYSIRAEKENNTKEWHEARKNAQNNLIHVKKKSRVDNPHALFDSLTNNITKKINMDPMNARFLDDFKHILRTNHRNIYEGVRDKLSYNQKDRVIFKTVMNALGNRIATHKHADLDGLAALKLLKECGFTHKDQYIKEVAHKDSLKGYIHVDVGGVNGIKVENLNTKALDHTSWQAYKKSLNSMLDQITVLLDHHHSINVNGKVSHGTTSSTYLVFKLLQYMNAIPADKYDQILQFVKFVDIVDTAAIEVIGNDFDNSHRTLIGLQKLILKDYKNIDFIYDQFEQTTDKKGNIIKPAKTGVEVLSDQYLEKAQVYIDGEKKPLKELSTSKQEANAKAYERAEQLLDTNQIVQSPLNDEIFIVDLDGKLLNAAEIANHLGYGVLKVLPDGKIFIYSSKYMQLDDKTWSTFGDYTRGHILFIDPSKISDWSRFEKVLFNKPENADMLLALRNKLLYKRGEVRQQKVQESQKALVTNIIHGAISKFVSSKPPMYVSDIKVGQEYDVVINNSKLIDKVGLYVTFAKNADKPDAQGKDSTINGLIHKSAMSPQQIMYYKGLIAGESVVKVVVTHVVSSDDGTYKIQVAPTISSQINMPIADTTKTA